MPASPANPRVRGQTRLRTRNHVDRAPWFYTWITGTQRPAQGAAGSRSRFRIRDVHATPGQRPRRIGALGRRYSPVRLFPAEVDSSRAGNPGRQPVVADVGNEQHHREPAVAVTDPVDGLRTRRWLDRFVSRQAPARRRGARRRRPALVVEFGEVCGQGGVLEGPALESQVSRRRSAPE